MDRPDPTRSCAVLVGTAIYADPHLPAIPAAARNVEDLSAQLTDPERWGLPADRCTDVVDPPSHVEVLDRLLDATGRATDTLLFYYAGHGLVARDGRLMLTASSTVRERAAWTGVPYETIRELISHSPAQRRVVILDCCFSGRALMGMSDPSGIVAGQLDGVGTFVLTSSGANTPSVAPAGERHTAFTAGLLGIIRDGLAEGPPFLCLDDLYDATSVALTAARFPRPQRLGSNDIGRMPVIRNAAWLPGRSRPASSRRPAGLVIPQAAQRRLDDVQAAVAAVARTLGPTGTGGEDALSGHRRRHPSGTGAEAIRGLMATMRQRYGDGAVTSAVIFGELLRGAADAVRDLVPPAEFLADLAASSRVIEGHLMRAQGLAPHLALTRVMRTALGEGDPVRLVQDAAQRAGADNVDVLAVRDGHLELSFESRWRLDGRVLAPSGMSGATQLDRPLVAFLPDGEVPRELVSSASRSDCLLVLAPAWSIAAARTVLHRFRTTVVVRPRSSVDLSRMRDQFAGPGAGAVHPARRALITASDLTIWAEAVRGGPSPTQATVRIGAAGRAADVETGVRARALAQAVAGSGAVPGGGVTLLRAAELRAGEPAPGRAWSVAALAAQAPLRQILVNLGHEPDRFAGAPALVTATDTVIDAVTGTVSVAADGGPLDARAVVRGSWLVAVSEAQQFLSHHLA